MDKKECKHSNSEDAALFRESVGEARPIKTRQRHVPTKQPSGRARLTRRAEAEALEASRSPEPVTPEPEHSDELVFRRDGISPRTMRELRRGKYALQDEIDLHGCTQDSARVLLQEFIEQSSRRGCKCIRVIHGKGKGSGPGGPVLKVRVNSWLRRWGQVLAFCPARDCDGGTGAIYVLLRGR